MKTYKLSPLFVFVILISIFSFNLNAQTDFAGTWKLVKGESELNNQFSLSPNKMIIDQKKNDIHIQRELNMQGQAVSIDEKFTLDGKECKNDGFQGSTKLSTVNWSDDKKSITINTAIKSNFGDIDTKQVYSMLESGKLKVVSTFNSSQGNISETWVLEKQE